MAKPKLTPWFPSDARPLWTGEYESMNLDGEVVRRWWDGAYWSTWYRTRDSAEDIAYRRHIKSRVQNHPWRGLAEKPE